MKIAVTNLGPIQSAEVELGGLTVFVGPNGTGKSYLAKVLYGLQQFQSLASYVFGHPQSFYQVIFSRKIETSQELLESLQQLTSAGLRQVVPALADLHRQFFLQNIGDFFNDDSDLFSNTTIEFIEIPSLEDHVYEGIINEVIENVKTLIARNDNDLLFPLWVLCYRVFTALGGGFADYFPAARSNFMLTYKALYRARADEHVGLESISDRLLLASKGSSTRKTGSLGRFDRPTEDFVSRIYDLDSSTSSPMAEVAAKLQSQLYGSGHLLIEQPEEALPNFRYKVENTENRIRLHLASSMVTETSPLVIGFKHWVTSSSLVIIDEPESHLHPEAQRSLVNVLADAVMQGVHIIVITHSPYILSCVNNLIKFGSLCNQFPDDDNVKKLREEQPEMVALRPEMVRAYHFGRDGLVKDIVRKTGLIDESEFTVPFNKISELYEAMRDIEWEHKA